MRNTITRKIICLTVASLFLINDICFGLGTMPGSTQPKTQEDMYALGQKLFAAKHGPGGGIDFDKYRPGTFIGEEPRIDGIKFIKADYNNLPKGWENNPIFQKTDLIEALKYFRDNEALIQERYLDIKEGYFEVDEEKGELPIARLEFTEKAGYVLVVHTKFVQMWNHIRRNDVWYSDDKNLPGRAISLAWSIFYRVAKHEMSDVSKGKDVLKANLKSLGHITGIVRTSHGNVSSLRVNENESYANEIGGRYALDNDAGWMWFLGSYCFGNSTRYDNEMFRHRIKWFFEEGKEGLGDLRDEFPILSEDASPDRINFAYKLATAINYNFFSRSEVVVPELKVDPKFIDEYKEREKARKVAKITEPPIYATGASSQISAAMLKNMLRLMIIMDGRGFRLTLEQCRDAYLSKFGHGTGEKLAEDRRTAFKSILDRLCQKGVLIEKDGEYTLAKGLNEKYDAVRELEDDLRDTISEMQQFSRPRSFLETAGISEQQGFATIQRVNELERAAVAINVKIEKLLRDIIAQGGQSLESRPRDENGRFVSGATPKAFGAIPGTQVPGALSEKGDEIGTVSRDQSNIALPTDGLDLKGPHMPVISKGNEDLLAWATRNAPEITIHRLVNRVMNDDKGLLALEAIVKVLTQRNPKKLQEFIAAVNEARSNRSPRDGRLTKEKIKEISEFAALAGDKEVPKSIDDFISDVNGLMYNYAENLEYFGIDSHLDGENNAKEKKEKAEADRETMRQEIDKEVIVILETAGLKGTQSILEFLIKEYDSISASMAMSPDDSTNGVDIATEHFADIVNEYLKNKRTAATVKSPKKPSGIAASDGEKKVNSPQSIVDSKKAPVPTTDLLEGEQDKLLELVSQEMGRISDAAKKRMRGSCYINAALAEKLLVYPDLEIKLAQKTMDGGQHIYLHVRKKESANTFIVDIFSPEHVQKYITDGTLTAVVVNVEKAAGISKWYVSPSICTDKEIKMIGRVANVDLSRTNPASGELGIVPDGGESPESLIKTIKSNPGLLIDWLVDRVMKMNDGLFALETIIKVLEEQNSRKLREFIDTIKTIYSKETPVDARLTKELFEQTIESAVIKDGAISYRAPLEEDNISSEVLSDVYELLDDEILTQNDDYGGIHFRTLPLWDKLGKKSILSVIEIIGRPGGLLAEDNPQYRDTFNMLALAADGKKYWLFLVQVTQKHFLSDVERDVYLVTNFDNPSGVYSKHRMAYDLQNPDLKDRNFPVPVIESIKESKDWSGFFAALSSLPSTGNNTAKGVPIQAQATIENKKASASGLEGNVPDGGESPESLTKTIKSNPDLSIDWLVNRVMTKNDGLFALETIIKVLKEQNPLKLHKVIAAVKIVNFKESPVDARLTKERLNEAILRYTSAAAKDAIRVVAKEIRIATETKRWDAVSILAKALKNIAGKSAIPVITEALRTTAKSKDWGANAVSSEHNRLGAVISLAETLKSVAGKVASPVIAESFIDIARASTSNTEWDVVVTLAGISKNASVKMAAPAIVEARRIAQEAHAWNAIKSLNQLLKNNQPSKRSQPHDENDRFSQRSGKSPVKEDGQDGEGDYQSPIPDKIRGTYYPPDVRLPDSPEYGFDPEEEEPSGSGESFPGWEPGEGANAVDEEFLGALIILKSGYPNFAYNKVLKAIKLLREIPYEALNESSMPIADTINQRENAIQVLQKLAKVNIVNDDMRKLLQALETGKTGIDLKKAVGYKETPKTEIAPTLESPAASQAPAGEVYSPHSTVDSEQSLSSYDIARMSGVAIDIVTALIKIINPDKPVTVPEMIGYMVENKTAFKNSRALYVETSRDVGTQIDERIELAIKLILKLKGMFAESVAAPSVGLAATQTPEERLLVTIRASEESTIYEKIQDAIGALKELEKIKNISDKAVDVIIGVCGNTAIDYTDEKSRSYFVAALGRTLGRWHQVGSVLSGLLLRDSNEYVRIEAARALRHNIVEKPASFYMVMALSKGANEVNSDISTPCQEALKFIKSMLSAFRPNRSIGEVTDGGQETVPNGEKPSQAPESQPRGEKGKFLQKPGKSPEDLLVLLTAFLPENSVITAPIADKIYREHYGEFGFDTPAENNIRTMERDLYESEDSLLGRGLIKEFQERGKNGERRFIFTDEFLHRLSNDFKAALNRGDLDNVKLLIDRIIRCASGRAVFYLVEGLEEAASLAGYRNMVKLVADKMIERAGKRDIPHLIEGLKYVSSIGDDGIMDLFAGKIIELVGNDKDNVWYLNELMEFAKSIDNAGIVTRCADKIKEIEQQFSPVIKKSKKLRSEPIHPFPVTITTVPVDQPKTPGIVPNGETNDLIGKAPTADELPNGIPEDMKHLSPITEEDLGKVIDGEPEMSAEEEAELRALHRANEAATAGQPLIQIISQYVIDIGAKAGPGSETLPAATLENLYKSVNLLEQDRLAIYSPQEWNITETMNGVLKDIGKHNGRFNAVSPHEYTKENLVKLLSAGLNDGTKKIVLVREEDAAMIAELIAGNSEIFKSTRLLTFTLPNNYGQMKNGERTVYQAQIMTRAILARLYENDKTPFVKALLTDMLRGAVNDPDQAGLESFLDELGRSDEEVALMSYDDFMKRVNRFLTRYVSLVEKIGHEIQLMKNFWIAA